MVLELISLIQFLKKKQRWKRFKGKKWNFGSRKVDYASWIFSTVAESMHFESSFFTRTSFSRVPPRGIWAVANEETLVAGAVKNVKRASIIQAFIPLHARAISLPTGEKERSPRLDVYF